MPLSPARTLKVFRYAMYFNGVSDYVEDGYVGKYVSNDFTISLWLLKPIWRNAIENIITNHQAYVDNDYSFQIVWIRDRLVFAWAPGAWTYITLTLSPPQGRWFTLMFSYSKSSNRWWYYEDGVLRNSGTANIVLGESNKRLQIGREINVNYYHGYIAQVLIYNRVLSDSEILWNYQYPDDPIRDGLVLWLQASPENVKDIDGDGVLEWIDLSGNNNHGKVYGARLVELAKAPARVLTPVRVSSPVR